MHAQFKRVLASCSQDLHNLNTVTICLSACFAFGGQCALCTSSRADQEHAYSVLDTPSDTHAMYFRAKISLVALVVVRMEHMLHLLMLD